MKIAMVAWHGCIRVYKEAMALQSAGHTVELIAAQVPFGYHEFNTFTLYGCDEQLIRSVAASDADIFHVHNEPDWLVVKTREGTKKPIVFDIHDLESLRWGKGPEEKEIAAFRAADAYIHVSEPCRTSAEIYHGKDKPARTIYAFCNERFVAMDEEIVTDPAWNSIVYEGGLDAKEFPRPMEGNPKQQKVNIRNMVGLFGHFVSQGYLMNCISASPIDPANYERVGVFVTQPVKYESMLFGLRPHGLGFVGASISAALMESAMPNKLFEYISQGVVPFTLHASEAGRFLKKHDCGIVLDNKDNLREQLAEPL